MFSFELCHFQRPWVTIKGYLCVKKAFQSKISRKKYCMCYLPDTTPKPISRKIQHNIAYFVAHSYLRSHRIQPTYRYKQLIRYYYNCYYHVQSELQFKTMLHKRGVWVRRKERFRKRIMGFDLMNCVICVQCKNAWQCRSLRRWLMLFNPLVLALSLKPRELLQCSPPDKRPPYALQHSVRRPIVYPLASPNFLPKNWKTSMMRTSYQQHWVFSAGPTMSLDGPAI